MPESISTSLLYAADPSIVRSTQKLDNKLPKGFSDFHDVDGELEQQLNTNRLTIIDSDSIRRSMERIKDPGLNMGQFRVYANTIISQLAQDVAKRNIPNKKTAISVRAGLAFLHHSMKFMPDSEVGFSTQTRDEQTAECSSVGAKLGSFAGKHAIIFDPMLATGGSMIDLIDEVIDRGATGVTTVSAFTAPQGLVAVSLHPSVDRMITTPLEAGLNENAYIVGAHQPHSMLGDFGDRYFGNANQ
jgi:uracil phosphoribosyltransferase